MQAVTVLILEMTYGESNQEYEPSTAEISITKLLRWLVCLRPKNAVAERAYNLISGILLNADPPTPISIREFLLEDKPVRNQAAQFQPHQGYHLYEQHPPWQNALGPESMANVPVQNPLDFAIPSQSLPGMVSAHADAGQASNLFPADMTYENPPPEAATTGDLFYLLQPGAALDLLVDPWSSEEADSQDSGVTRSQR